MKANPQKSIIKRYKSNWTILIRGRYFWNSRVMEINFKNELSRTAALQGLPAIFSSGFAGKAFTENFFMNETFPSLSSHVSVHKFVIKSHAAYILANLTHGTMFKRFEEVSRSFF